MEYRKVSINDIIPYENNPRINTGAVKYVKESISQCGYISPIIVDENMVILAGHTRRLALLEMGVDEIEIGVAAGLTDEQKRKYRVLDNKTNEFATWDFEKLTEELENIDFGDFDFGFDFTIEQEEQKEVVQDEYEPQNIEEPKAKKGDIYQLGNHRLMCGDSTNLTDVEKLMNNNIADISFSSPPYNAGTTPTEVSMQKDTKYNGNDDDKSEEEYREFLNSYIRNAICVSQFVFMNIQSLANNKTALIDVLYDNKDIYADTIIWDKQHGQPAMGKNVLNSVYEYIHIFSKKANRSVGTIEFRGTIDNIMHLSIQRHNEYSDIHNATYSVEFANWFISRFAKNSVYEPFGGTGTDIIVCEQLNKTCYCMEYEPKYVDVIIDRWQTFTGKKAVLLNK